MSKSGWLIGWVLLGFGVGLIGCGRTTDATEVHAEEVKLATRVFEFIYTARVPAPPEGARNLEIWVPLPMTDPGVQEVADLRTSVNGSEKMGQRTTDSVYGNEMFHVALPNPEKETVVSWSATLTRYEDVGQGSLATVPQYLEANRLIPIDAEARELAARLGVDRTDLPKEDRAKFIYQDVLDEMEYNKKIPGYGQGDFNRSLTVCKGNCTDFHARFIGTGRAAQIPSRFTMGIPMKSDATGTYNSYHCWAHWFNGEHWVPVDISEADKIVTTDPEGAKRFFGRLDANRIALSFGRDIVLEPKQEGEPLNYFVFPYAEADGAEVKMDKTMWEFKYSDVQL